MKQLKVKLYQLNNLYPIEKMKENLNDQLPSIISPIVKQYIQKNCIQEADIILLLVLLFVRNIFFLKIHYSNKLIISQ